MENLSSMLNVKDEIIQTCEICMKILDDISNCETLDVGMKDIIEILFIKSEVQVNPDSVICTYCSEKLREAFDFKTMCIETEDILVPFIDSKNGEKVDVSTVFTNLSSNSDESFQKTEFCRLCRKSNGIECMIPFKQFLEDPKIMEVFERHIPEMDIKDTKNPLVCNSCVNIVKNFSSFLLVVTELNKGMYLDDHQLPSTSSFPIANNSSSISNCSNGGNVSIKTETDETHNEINNFLTVVTKLGNSDETSRVDKDSKQQVPVTFYKRVLVGDQWVYVKGDPVEANNANQNSKVDTQNATKNINRKQNEIKVGPASFDIPLVLSEVTYFCENCKFGDKCGHGDSKSHKVFELGMFYCANCDYKTNDKALLGCHMLVHKAPFETKTFKCSKCKYETKHRSALNSHSLTHKGRNETRMYACNDCDFETKNRASITDHVKLHRKKEEVETFNCPHCDYKAKCKGNLRTHLIYHQTPQLAKWYNCDKCSFKTRYKTNFRRHMIVHQAPDKVRFHKCQFCEYKSKHWASIQKHLLCHDTGDVKIYNCSECDYETKHKNNLQRHVLSHKKYGEVSMLKCPECDYETNNKNYLRTHQKKRHNPQAELYRCPQCEYSTIYKGNLTKHEVVHQTDPADCPLCDHKAKNKFTLKQHMRTHNRENASKRKCPYCDFKSYNSIKNHVFKHHGIIINKSRDHLRKYKPPQTQDEN